MASPPTPKPKKVLAILINCNGRMKLSDCPRFEEIEVNANHKVFQSPKSPISEHLDIPLQLCQTATSAAEESNSRTNQHATFLMRCLDPRSESFGFARDEWQSPAGNVIAARADGKDLELSLIQLMSDYNLTRVMVILGDNSEGDIPPEKTMKEITKFKFQQFVEEWRCGGAVRFGGRMGR